MKKHICILILLTFTSLVFCQTADTTSKKKPIFFFLTLRAFNEFDQVFSNNRKFADNKYAYFRGLGATIYIPIIYERKRIMMGAEFGQYFFWNNNIETNTDNETFKKRGQMNPIMLSTTYKIIGSKYFGLSIMANIGASYNQQINKFSDSRATVTSNIKPLLLVAIKIRIGSNSTLVHNLSMGLGNLYADNRNFRTVGAGLPIIIPR